MTDRYDTTGNVEAQFEPGSSGRVLASRLGNSDPQEMEDIEPDLASIQAGMADYGPMKGLVRRVLRETARNADA